MADPAGALRARIAALREPVARYVATMIADAATAQDLAQDALVRAVARLDELRDPSRLRSWVYAIAANACRGHLRRAVQGEQRLKHDPASLRGSVLSSLVRRESAAVLAVAIDRLPILLREAFALHVVEGLSYDDMVEITGASAATLHVRVHRARALLRRQLGAVVDTFWLR